MALADLLVGYPAETRAPTESYSRPSEGTGAIKADAVTYVSKPMLQRMYEAYKGPGTKFQKSS